ncbi:MAG: hypothetical protein C5B49_16540, partial [Bdellovibrio sp.]
MLPEPETSVAVPSAPALQTNIPQPAASPANPGTSARRPKGKVASLTKAQRDTINGLLHDGATYALVA